MATKTKRLTLDEILNTPVAYVWSKVRPGERQGVVDPIVCADGHTLSVQASVTHYATPRDNRGPWTHVEVGYPTAQPEATWVRYRDGDDWKGIYGFVPVELVREFIEIHGGEASA